MLLDYNAISGKRLLWADDDIHQLAPFVKELENCGFVVATADSTDGALSIAKTCSFDIILVDILMPPPDGIELLRRLRPLQGGASLVALSSFLYLNRYRDQLRSLGFAVEIIDKDIPNVAAPDFEDRFLKPIIDVALLGVTRTVADQEKQMAELSEENPFDIPLTEFMKKPLVEKDRLAQVAAKMAANTLDEAFKRDHRLWILLCGSATQVRQFANTLDEIPPEDDVMEFARRQQRPPYQFFRDVTVDDVWTTCGMESGLRHYPTVTLEFRDHEERVVVHFDTGAPMTFFSYEELVRVRAIRPTNTFTWTRRSGHDPYPMVLFEIKVMLSGYPGGSKAEVILRGQAVRDWHNGPYARFCDPACDGYSATIFKQLCSSRKGLVGRNVLIDNAITLILDGATKQTRVGDR